MGENIYFMDYIIHHFSNLEVLRRILIEGGDYNNNITLEQIFEKVNNNSDIGEIFNTHINWSNKYERLGFIKSIELHAVHREWRSIVGKCKNDGGKILFKKNIYKLKIKFD